MIWLLGEQGALRVERERRAIAELAESVPWLRVLGWRLDRVGVQLCVDADIVRSEAVSFPITLRYPDLFPHTPPSVLPRGDVKERWSEHQYLVADRPTSCAWSTAPTIGRAISAVPISCVVRIACWSARKGKEAARRRLYRLGMRQRLARSLDRPGCVSLRPRLLPRLHGACRPPPWCP